MMYSSNNRLRGLQIILQNTVLASVCILQRWRSIPESPSFYYRLGMN